jgi:hypothetical protein
MRKSGGGAATAGGMDYQQRVAAWVTVHILAEKDAAPPWDLSTGTTLEWLRCESDQPVDDLQVRTSAKGLIFAQIKRTLECSEDADSDLASAIDQFVRQYVDSRERIVSIQSEGRLLDIRRDRLVLITSPTSSGSIRIHLRSILSRVRSLLRDQSLDHAAENKDERRVLSIVKLHSKRSWQKKLGAGPSDDELRQLLSLIHVQTLDVEEGSPGESEVRTLLRNSVLQDSDEGDSAWAQLIKICGVLAATRSGVGRLYLQEAILKVGIKLKSSRSFRNDIEKLKQYSALTLSALAHLAQFRVGSAAIKIRRPATEALKRAVEEKSILVVGEPGAGKSGVLHNLVEAFQEEGRDYIFLSVDRLAAHSFGEVRIEIGLDHELPEVLENWVGSQPAFFVIDALDAARGDPTGAMIRDLIRQLTQKRGRWHVVASIRKFDLRYGVEIRSIFEGPSPSEFQNDEFRGVRHLNVPYLSDSELNQIAMQSAELHALVISAPEKLHDLLHVPFNIRLMADLLSTGVAASELTPIRTQLELLDRYWSYRVINEDKQGDAREGVLRKACQKMVDARVLRVDRSEVTDPGNSANLRDLLSSQVLIEWPLSSDAQPDRYILAFSHHVLFDYAVTQLLLRGTHEALVRRLVSDPELAVVVRPSFLLYFRQLWTVNSGHQQFWDLVFRIMREDQIPEIGKIIGPSIAADLARELPDLEPLCISLDDPILANQSAAEQVLRHLFGALLASPPNEFPLLGPSAGPWCQLLERVSRVFRLSLAYTVRPLLSAICERPSDFTCEQRIAAGNTARRLHEFARSQMPRDNWLVIHALEGVCRTFESDPMASAALIRSCLESQHLAKYGFEELPWLAREVKRLISLDSGLTEEIFRVAFSYQETSTEATPMGTSRILPLISNRRQDYEMALYELAEVFPEFLEYSQEKASSAFIAIMEAYVVQRHPTAPGEVYEETFDFDGRMVRLRTDFSRIWDKGDSSRHDEPLKMLDDFQQYLEKLAEQPEAVERVREIVQLLIIENSLAVIWRRLIIVATRHPGTLGRDILPFAWANPILTCYDTTIPAGEYIRAIFPMLVSSERERIELAILGIPVTFPSDQREAGEQIRNRLLGCLTGFDLVNEGAHHLLEQLKTSNTILPNNPPVRFASWSGPYGEEEYLKDQGVPVEAEANRKIRELEQPVNEFTEKHLNSAPSIEAVSSLFPSLERLYNNLCSADKDGVHPKQYDQAWGTLAAACARIARANELTCTEPLGMFVKAVLLEGSCCIEPTYHAEYEAQFDEHPSWGGASPRVESAEGLILLGRHPTCLGPDILEAIERLSKDPVSAVRFQISKGLNTLYKTTPEFMWRLIDRISREELSRGVLQGLLGGPFARLIGVEMNRILTLTKTIFDRTCVGPGSSEVRKICLGLFTDSYIWRANILCQEVVQAIAIDPLAYLGESLCILSHLRAPVTYGPTEPPDSEADAVRRRALDLLENILRSACKSLRQLEDHYAGISFNEWPQHDQETVKSLLRLINSIGSEIYIASGAHDGKKQAQSGGAQRQKLELGRFYRETGTIINELADAGLASVTHHLLETLEFFIPQDPLGIFLCIGRVVRAGQRGGYQHESLASDLVVRLVERYLAEYRTLLREDADCRKILIEILDIFVKAGWPAARRITFRLDEIFR